MAQGPGRGIDGKPFSIDGIEFVPSWSRPSKVSSLTLLKASRMVEPYRELFAAHPHPNVVELGISQGGSVALLALLARPRRMVALELAPDPVEALSATLEAHDLDRTIRPHYGVDQADQEAVRRIVESEFGDAPLDVVIDDASHLYEPTLASFEVLFPRLRPGGLYVIEDWTWHDSFARNFADALSNGSIELDDKALANLEAHMTGAVTPERPLSLLSLQLVLACAQSPAIAEVRSNEDWTVIERGDADLSVTDFHLADLFVDRYRVLADGTAAL
jgi:predicted O-methyltransferase YrrM